MPETGTTRALHIHDLHAALGARFGEFAGWRMPLWYRGAVVEHNAVRQEAGIFDISHMGRFRVEGADVATGLSSLFSRDFSRLEAGRSIYALACSERGGILDDLMVYRLATDRFVVICNAANRPVIKRILSQAMSDAAVTDVQSETVLFAVQGPEAVDAVAGAMDRRVSEIARRGCAELDAGGSRYFLARTGYTGEDGFEVMTSVDAGRALFQRLMGEAGCVPCGLAARDTLRLEAALPLYGLDIDESATPWEAGLGWALDLEHDFTGRDALEAAKGSEGRRLSCLVSEGPGVLRAHLPVYAERREVSATTSGGFSPTLDRSIGMAYLPNALTAPGTAVEVDVRGRRVTCRVVKRPFYRSESRKDKPA